MNWSTRLQILIKEAERTYNFSHNKTCRRLYDKLKAAIDKKDAETTKQLIVKMGF